MGRSRQDHDPDVARGSTFDRPPASDPTSAARVAPDAARSPSERSIIRGRDMGAVRPRGWVRPGLTVQLAKYDRRTGGVDTGCYHVLRGDGYTLCGSRVDRPHWRDAGWADSERICCKNCGKWLWTRWCRGAAGDLVSPGRSCTILPEDDWVARLAPAAYEAVRHWPG